MKEIKQPVINTFNRVGIDYEQFDNETKMYTAVNRFTGEKVITTQLMVMLVNWVYNRSNEYELGIQKVKIEDFDRIRYFILDQDPDVYSTCID